jgi:hypothetical protein
VGQQVPEFTLPHFGFSQQSDRIGEAAKIIQKWPVKLLSVDDIIYAILPLEILHFYIYGFGEKFFPSFEFLLGLFGVFLHFFSPAPVFWVDDGRQSSPLAGGCTEGNKR